MKSSRIFVPSFVLFLVVFTFAMYGQAALVDNGDGTVTDTDKNIMWLQDTSNAIS